MSVAAVAGPQPRAGARSSTPWRRVCGPRAGRGRGPWSRLAPSRRGAGAAASGRPAPAADASASRNPRRRRRGRRARRGRARRATPIGSPATTTRSARMPGASRPRSDCRPSAQAPPPVIAVTASSGVSPDGASRPRRRWLPSSPVERREREPGARRPAPPSPPARGRRRARRRSSRRAAARPPAGSVAAGLGVRRPACRADAAARIGRDAAGTSPSDAAAVVTPPASTAPAVAGPRRPISTPRARPVSIKPGQDRLAGAVNPSARRPAARPGGRPR